MIRCFLQAPTDIAGTSTGLDPSSYLIPGAGHSQVISFHCWIWENICEIDGILGISENNVEARNFSDFQ